MDDESFLYDSPAAARCGGPPCGYRVPFFLFVYHFFFNHFRQSSLDHFGGRATVARNCFRNGTADCNAASVRIINIDEMHQNSNKPAKEIPTRNQAEWDGGGDLRFNSVGTVPSSGQQWKAKDWSQPSRSYVPMHFFSFPSITWRFRFFRLDERNLIEDNRERQLQVERDAASGSRQRQTQFRVMPLKPKWKRKVAAPTSFLSDISNCVGITNEREKMWKGSNGMLSAWFIHRLGRHVHFRKKRKG